MENFDTENIDKLLEIRQYFLPSKLCAVQYSIKHLNPPPTIKKLYQVYILPILLTTVMYEYPIMHGCS